MVTWIVYFDDNKKIKIEFCCKHPNRAYTGNQCAIQKESCEGCEWCMAYTNTDDMLKLLDICRSHIERIED